MYPDLKGSLNLNQPILFKVQHVVINSLSHSLIQTQHSTSSISTLFGTDDINCTSLKCLVIIKILYFYYN